MRLLGFDISRVSIASIASDQRVEPQLSTPTTGPSASSGLTGFLTGADVRPGFARGGVLPRVTPDRASTHGTVFACCNNIAGDLAKVPIKIFQRDGDGKETRVREHPAAWLLNQEADEGLPSQLVRFSAVYAYALRGNGFIYAPRDGGGDLLRLELVQQGTAHLHRSGSTRFYDFADVANVQRRVPARSMVHLRYLAEDGWNGRSPLSVAAESVGIAMAGQRAAARNAAGGTLKAVLKLGAFLDDEEKRERVARSVKAAISDPDSDGVPVVGPEDEIQPLDLSAADRELLASRKFDREMIAGIYRMPPFKLQMLEYGVKANGEQQAIDYLTDCLLHWSALVESQLSIALLTRAERQAGLFLRHDFGALLQTTVKERNEALAKAVGGPFRTPNEARRIEGLPPVDGGDVLNPAPNMTRKDSQ